MNNKIQLGKWLSAFIFAVLLIVIYKTLDNFIQIKDFIGDFFRIISPFIFAILIACLLYVPCTKLENVYGKVKFLSKKPRLFSVLTVYLLLVFIIALIIQFILPVLFQSVTDLINTVPMYYSNIIEKVRNIPEESFLYNFNIKEGLETFYNNNLNKILDPVNVEQYAKSLIGIASGIFNAVVSLIASLYILLERENIVKFFNKLSKAIFKEKTHNRLKRYLEEINKVIFTFLASKGLDSLINATVIILILLILNIKYALLLGLLAGLANFIPYFGSLMSVIFISIITFITGGFAKGLEVLTLLIIFQQIDGNIIEPKIMGNNLKISPLLVIFAVIVGGAYFGIVGMFLAVPIATILKSIIIEYIDSKKIKGKAITE